MQESELNLVQRRLGCCTDQSLSLGCRLTTELVILHDQLDLRPLEHLEIVLVIHVSCTDTVDAAVDTKLLSNDEIAVGESCVKAVVVGKRKCDADHGVQVVNHLDTNECGVVFFTDELLDKSNPSLELNLG